MYALYFVDEEKQHVSQVKKVSSCSCSKVEDIAMAMQKMRSRTRISQISEISEISDDVVEIDATFYSGGAISTISTTPVDTNIIYETCIHRQNHRQPDLISHNLPNQSDSMCDMGRKRWSNASRDFLLPICEHGNAMLNMRRHSWHMNN